MQIPQAVLVRIVILLFLVTPSLAASNPHVLYVATNGTDSVTCGPEADRCRSISRAIAHASDGDNILVGPGRYGDVDGDGFFGPHSDLGAGDEAREAGFGCFCVVKVNKRVQIESRDGSEATVIDSDAPGGINAIVQITASQVEFGAPAHGFTIGNNYRPSVSDGIEVVATEGVTVAGNRVTSVGTALHAVGSGHTLLSNEIRGGGGIRVDGTGHRIENNSIRTSGNGIELHGNNHVVTHNLSNGNLIGLFVSGSGHVIRENAFLGNFGAGGILIGSSTSDITITRNNIFGNWQAGTYPLWANCGTLNVSGATIDASENFWGAATGPGPDPADLACDDSVSHPGSFTVTSPPASKEFVIPGK